MGLFGRSQVTRREFEDRLASLDSELRRQASAVRQLEAEQTTLHDQVRKWMRRAVAAERTVERAGGTSPPAVTPEPRRPVWGPRARRMARLDPLQQQSVEGNGDGVHP